MSVARVSIGRIAVEALRRDERVSFLRLEVGDAFGSSRLHRALLVHLRCLKRAKVYGEQRYSNGHVQDNNTTAHSTIKLLGQMTTK